MAIYKKSVAFSNLGIGFLFGIEGFLYGLVVVAVINTSITIVMASYESSIPIYKLYRLIIVQVVLAAIALLLTLYLVQFLPSLAIISLSIKLVLFSSVYILVNYLFKSLSFQYFLEQIFPMFKQ